MEKLYSVILWLAALAMTTALVGCGEKAASPTPTGAKPKSSNPIKVFSAPSETVIAKVDGEPITVGQLREFYQYDIGMYRHYNQGKVKPEDMEARSEQFMISRCGDILPRLVHCALLNRYLKAECGGLEVADEITTVSNALKQIGGRKRLIQSTEDFAKELGVSEEMLRYQLLLAKREEKARRQFDPSHTQVSEKEIDEGLKRLDAYIAMAVASNKVTRATCAAVMERVKAGADFALTAKEIGAYEPGEAVEWEGFIRAELDNVPELRDWAFKAKVGEIGGPFDLDDGLSIVKVIAHTDGMEDESLAAAEVETVRLARITFLMLVEEPEPRTREHCREALTEWKLNDANKRLFEQLFGQAKIEYPSGDKLDFTKEAK